MTKVFVGGSRSISHLTNDVQHRLDHIIQQNMLVLLGDANGADKAVQKFLCDRHYQSVLVFCMEQQCRNNLGNWPLRLIENAGHKKGYAYYVLKDEAMAREADYGFMLWDGKSKGTLNNVINLLRETKKVLVYLAPDKRFCALTQLNELDELLTQCDQTLRQFFATKLTAVQPIHHAQPSFELGK